MSKLLNYYEKYMLLIGVLGQALFYAQAFKIFSTHSAEDVSLFGFSLGLISVTSWLLYGIFLKNRVLILANTFAVGGAICVIAGIFLYA